MNKLTGKVAIVTGASKGIGAALAKGLAAAGAAVAVNYVADKAGAERTVTEMTDPSPCRPSAMTGPPHTRRRTA